MLSRDLSSRIFIGRDEEIALFKDMLGNPHSPTWILSLIGPGGQGKTQLLTKFVEIARTRRVAGQEVSVTTTPIDLYWTAHQREIGILISIAYQLKSGDEFAEFQAQVVRHRSLLSQESSPEQLRRSTLEAREFFLKGYHELSERKRIVLLFDTVELAGEALTHFWQDILPQLHRNTLVVIAGRKPVPILPETQVIQRKIKGFSAEQIASYLNEQGITTSNDVVARIAELSGGRPILVALVVDWIRDGHAFDELLDYAQSDFEKGMVEYVHKMKYPEDQAILVMAYLYRRFNAEILEQVLDLPLKTSDLMSNLARFTFIKYRSGTKEAMDSCLLHDEMRDLINEYVWPAVDPMGEYRRELNEKIIDYYINKIEAASDPLEEQDLCVERLYYWFDVDVKGAFSFSSELFEKAYEGGDVSLMASINDVVKHYEKKLLWEMKRELAFRTAMVLYHRNRYRDATEILEQLIVVDEPGLLEARSFAHLVPIYANSPRPYMALNYGAKCEALCNSLLEQHEDETEQGKVNQVLYLLYNNLGYAWRQALGDLGRAIEYYNKALYSPGLERKPYLLARARNNLAFALCRKGRIDEALFLCKSGLQIRLSLKDPEEVGLSYNVMGTIYAAMDRDEDATWAFEKALEQFAIGKSERGKGLVNIAYGKLLRQLGWHEETGELKSVIDGKRQLSLIDEQSMDFERRISRNEKYRKAKSFFEEAGDIFARRTEWANQAEALNELGCLYRQVDDVEKALDYFNRSIACSKEAGNQFREGDSLLDLAILYYRCGDLSKASKSAKYAKVIAEEFKHYYLYGKCQHLLAAIALKKEDYDLAFECAADACVYVVKQRSKVRAYFDVLDSVSFYLRQLPSYGLVYKKTQSLIDRWQKEGLANQYPGFILRMNSLAQDYLLFNRGGESNE